MHRSRCTYLLFVCRCHWPKLCPCQSDDEYGNVHKQIINTLNPHFKYSTRRDSNDIFPMIVLPGLPSMAASLSSNHLLEGISTCPAWRLRTWRIERFPVRAHRLWSGEKMLVERYSGHIMKRIHGLVRWISGCVGKYDRTDLGYLYVYRANIIVHFGGFGVRSVTVTVIKTSQLWDDFISQWSSCMFSRQPHQLGVSLGSCALTWKPWVKPCRCPFIQAICFSKHLAVGREGHNVETCQEIPIQFYNVLHNTCMLYIMHYYC